MHACVCVCVCCAGVDVTRDPVPVLPTVHYNMAESPPIILDRLS